ncbi:MAG: hypothetical protein KAJ30_00775 [Candidatus Heimdallarchaeota archaeon]|nr:hypothetical protein [Thermodesulfovibrionia bacterium]MCK5408770.1 hypothetical protein [Candidatus Heimdallarchaeota archaeon]
MNKKENKKGGKEVTQEKKLSKDKTLSTKRQIIIETDGNSIEVVKAEVAGDLELIAILNTLLSSLTKK